MSLQVWEGREEEESAREHFVLVLDFLQSSVMT